MKNLTHEKYTVINLNNFEKKYKQVILIALILILTKLL